MKKTPPSPVNMNKEPFLRPMDHAINQRRIDRLKPRESAIFAQRVCVYRLALRLTHHREAAEDLTQEALLRAYRSAETPDNWAAWLTRITVNLFLNERGRSAPLTLLREPSTEVPHENLAIQMALAQLPREQQAILALAHGEGRRYQEIALALGIPEGTVGSRLHAARKAFRAAYGEEE